MRRKLSAVICLCVATMLLSSGCEPLRKKFVRKKKEDKKEEFTPILEPIVYEKAYQDPKERYAYYYSLWNVWDKDVGTTFSSRNPNLKRQQSLVDQMIIQLQEMRKYLIEQKQAELDVLITRTQSALKELNKPSPLINYSSLKRELSRIGKTVRENFKPSNEDIFPAL